MNRRTFVRNGVVASAGIMSHYSLKANAMEEKTFKPIVIKNVSSDFEREPLIRPFGFKGGAMKEIWQTANFLQSEKGNHAIGLCTQNVLWSDAVVFSNYSESGSNALMYALTTRALQMIKGTEYLTPVEMLDRLLPEVYEYGKKITSNSRLRKTFALNALVGLDNAAWLLFARDNGLSTFDSLIPEKYRPSLSQHHPKVAAIPLMAYNIPVSEIQAAAEQGYFFMKIKIGQSGTQEEMLEKDKARLSEIHQILKNVKTPHTQNGKLPYYFDANGRYEKREYLMKLLDHAQKIGAFDQIVLIEEPFAEELEMDVSDIPVRLAADESAHTDIDALKRIQMGYKAIALKPIAKTLSMTLMIAQAAYEKDIPCFCADLTVNPVLVEWNKNVAARLNSFPGLGHLGLMESNGHQNYKNWSTMMNYYPQKDAEWIKPKNGVYTLNEEYYQSGGGIFDSLPHYEQLFSSLL